jgi:E3 ubiquitin-protein ligase TRIP12
LNFTFPGYDEIDLKENGIDTPVTIHNLHEYVELVSHFYLVETIKTQVYYFREGFEKVH